MHTRRGHTITTQVSPAPTSADVAGQLRAASAHAASRAPGTLRAEAEDVGRRVSREVRRQAPDADHRQPRARGWGARSLVSSHYKYSCSCFADKLSAAETSSTRAAEEETPGTSRDAAGFQERTQLMKDLDTRIVVQVMCNEMCISKADADGLSTSLIACQNSYDL